MPTKNLVPRADGEGKLGIKGASNLTWKEVNAVSGSFDELSNSEGNDLIAAGSGITITKISTSGSQYEISSSGASINSINDISDVDTATAPPTGGQALVWNNADSEWQPGTISTTQFSNWSDVSGSIIPDTNSAYDIGSAELKVQHLYLSSNSLHIGSTPTESYTLSKNLNSDLVWNKNGVESVLATEASVSNSLTNYATTDYVNDTLQGLDAKESVVAATTGALSGYTYINNVFTDGGTTGALSIDGHNLSNNDRILVKDQVDAIENGIYSVSNIGGSSVTLTRVSDLTNADQDADDFDGAFVFVQNGTTNAGRSYVAKPTTLGQTTVGTHAMSWVTFTSSTVTSLNNLSDVTYDSGTLDIDDLSALKFNSLNTSSNIIYESNYFRFYNTATINSATKPAIEISKNLGNVPIINAYAASLNLFPFAYTEPALLKLRSTVADSTQAGSIIDASFQAVSSIYDTRSDSDGVLIQMGYNQESDNLPTEGEPSLMIRNTNANLRQGPSLNLENYSGSSALVGLTPNRVAGKIKFRALSGFSTFLKNTAVIESNIIDPGSATGTPEDDFSGDLKFHISVSGSLTEALSISSTSDFTTDPTNGDASPNHTVNVVNHDGANNGLALSGSLVTSTADELNVLDVHTLAPTDGQVLTYSSGSTSIVWADVASAGGGGSAPSVITDSSGANTTISTTSGIEEIHLISNGSNAVTITLPAAATAGSGYKYNIKQLGTANVTIDANGLETIDGSLTFVITSQYSSVTLVTDGSNWFII